MTVLKHLLIFLLALAMISCDDDEDSPTASNNPDLPASVAGTIVEMEFSFANAGAPWALGTLMHFTFSSSGMLFIDENPAANDGDEIQIDSVELQGSEFIWEDAASGYSYALSMNGAAINEVNLMQGSNFLGQFTPTGN